MSRKRCQDDINRRNYCCRSSPFGATASAPRWATLPAWRYFSLDECGSIEAAIEAAKEWRRSRLSDVNGTD